MVPPPPKQLGDGTWRVTCIDGTTYRSRFKPKPRRIPPTAPPKPTALTKPATPSPPSLPSPPASIPSPVGANLPPSTLSAATEDATAQDAPMDTSDDVMALEADALNIFPNTPFQPGGQAAQGTCLAHHASVNHTDQFFIQPDVATTTTTVLGMCATRHTPKPSLRLSLPAQI
ncbi:hypothetical protein PENSPDRAFT_658162 [Peniophora sp. CONT]|nr:hypothetical protein PENSPDRAFT_658162 [Peniophora sp. CONT]